MNRFNHFNEFQIAEQQKLAESADKLDTAILLFLLYSVLGYLMFSG